MLSNRRATLIVVLLCALAVLVFSSFRLMGPHTIALTSASGGITVDITKERAYWKSRIQAVGDESAYAELAQAVASVTDVQAHNTAHAFGLALYDVKGISGIRVCDERFGMGCIHQVIGTAIADMGITELVAKIRPICSSFESYQNEKRCHHGIGHSLVSLYGYSIGGLRQALSFCNEISSDTTPIFGCKSGVFMEYSKHSLIATDAEPRTFSESEKYEPCISLTDKYERATCIFWQPIWWYWFLDAHATTSPFAIMGVYCGSSELSPYESRTCVEGIGFMAVRPQSGASKVSAADACHDVSNDPERRILCWSYAQTQLYVPYTFDTAAHVCGGLTRGARDYCVAHINDRADADPKNGFTRPTVR